MTGLDNAASPLPFDVNDAMATAGDDRAFLVELIEMFREQWPPALATIRAAVGAGDGPALARAAHTLRGTVASFGAKPAMDTTLAIEVAARDGHLDAAAAAAAPLESVMTELDRALVAFAQDEPVG